MAATAGASRPKARLRRGRIRASLVCAGLVTALAVPLAGMASAQGRVPGPPSGDGEQPTQVAGNPNCDTLMPGSFLFSFKQEPPANATDIPLSFNGLTGTLDITLRNTSQGQVFDYTFDGDFTALGVIVKGGPNANFYDYRPGGNTADTSLHAPINPNNNRYFGLSHIDFCIGEAPPGALKILKQSTKTGNPLVTQAGAVFNITGPNGYDEDVTDDTTMAAPDEDPTIGEVCVSGLRPGQYTVNETTPPPGYGAASQEDVTVQVVSGTTCTTNPPAAAATATFTNPPLADLLVRVDGQESGEILSTITCNGNSTGPSDPAILNVNDLPPGTYNCEIVIDP
ncbi:prealbumin-like fold domain-containing protein [Streptomyces sp. NBC_01351]|uniref:MSCRAMM family protein n=1 Tax=Streptomyces sp. NBC_01351 TaxID=2903833 RepID=UPI002E2FF343|nr:prealbumin-like fold domain-containing protein [Streptomyces sp. NBC_01351]